MSNARQVLVVDADPAARRAMVAALLQLGHVAVGEAGSAEEALARARALRPQLVTLDLGVLGERGELALLDALTEEVCAAVVVTASHNAATLAGALARRGAGAIVRVPYALPDLAIALEVALTRFQDLVDLRRQTEDAKQERVRLLQVFHASVDGIYIARDDGVMSMINESGLRLLGMSHVSMAGRRIDEWTETFQARDRHGRPIDPTQLPLRRALQGERVRDMEVWVTALDRVERCLSIAAAPALAVQGRIIEAVATLRDVTPERELERATATHAERRRLELDLLSRELLAAGNVSELAHRSASRVREALGADRARVILTNIDGKNRVLTAAVGERTPQVTSTLPPSSRSFAMVAMEKNTTVWSNDLHAEPRYGPDMDDLNHRSGVAVPLAAGGRVLGVLVATALRPGALEPDDVHLVGLMANQLAVSLEHLRVSERLLEQQKLAALGTMAAGVVHEIRNPMTYIHANVDSALEFLNAVAEAPGAPLDLQRLDEERSGLTDARNGCSRIFRIVDDIRTYAHPGRDKRELNDLNRIVEVALTLAAQELRRHAKVNRDFGRIPPMLFDGSKISQVVLNLLVNAAQALGGSGRVGQVDIITRYEDGEAIVVVRDDGPGMSPEVQAKIWDPFFTTKPAGFGSGLGLAICRRLIEEQGGRIELLSAPGQGARFTVRLPAEPK